MEIGNCSGVYVPRFRPKKGMEIESPITSSEAANAYGVYETKALVSELCKQFYGLGWVSGTGGSVSIKVHDDKKSKSDQVIVMSPSGVQKERMMPEDMYVLSSNGVVLSTPPSKPYPYKFPKCSECTPLFLQAYKIRNAGAVIHSHGIESCLVTMIRPLMKEFRITHMEMIKGIEGHGYNDKLIIPIIENTAKEGELIDSFTEAIRSYPKSTAVLVRNHGVYIWGETWISAKTQAECYHYLFDAAVKLHQMGLDWSTLDHDTICNVNTVREFFGNSQRGVWTKSINGSVDTVEKPPHCCILLRLDTTHVSMSSDVLCSRAVHKLVSLLRSNQDHTLPFRLFDDVPKALKRWHASGIKVYIFSGNCRKVQHFLYSHTNFGDLRKYISGFFEGKAKERRSFKDIFLTVGVDNPADVLYVTDNLEEANEAEAAGLKVILITRTKNKDLTQQNWFRTVESLLEIC